MVGISMKKGELSWATTTVAEAQAAATNGLDFSLGNEPDLDTRRTIGHSARS